MGHRSVSNLMNSSMASSLDMSPNAIHACLEESPMDNDPFANSVWLTFGHYRPHPEDRHWACVMHPICRSLLVWTRRWSEHYLRISIESLDFLVYLMEKRWNPWQWDRWQALLLRLPLRKWRAMLNRDSVGNPNCWLMEEESLSFAIVSLLLLIGEDINWWEWGATILICPNEFPASTSS